MTYIIGFVPYASYRDRYEEMRKQYRRGLAFLPEWTDMTLDQKIANLEASIARFSRHMEEKPGTIVPRMFTAPIDCISHTRDHLAELYQLREVERTGRVPRKWKVR